MTSSAAKPDSTPAVFKLRRMLIGGASGMIGTALIGNWMRDSIPVLRLTRGQPDPKKQNLLEFVKWDPASPNPFVDLAPLQGVDAAVHLSGANVAAGRWTPKYKREIVSSRVETTRSLAKALSQLDPLPRVLVCASAIGIYGNRGEEILDESSPPGAGFLAETCIAWEEAARAAEDAGIRVVHLRFGVVLSPQGGALAKLLPLFRLGLGGNLGDGRAWMPWITLRDAIGIVNYCIQNEDLRGPVNAVSPQPSTNAEFTQALGAALHRPAVVPAPAFALRLVFGEMADEALLASACVVPGKLAAAGYSFADPKIGPALRSLLS